MLLSEKKSGKSFGLFTDFETAGEFAPSFGRRLPVESVRL